jgi:hypothetical protein
MPITFCFQCGKYLRLGQKREYANFCGTLCFERYSDRRIRLSDLELEYWRDTHPQRLSYYSDRRKVGGLHAGLEEM